MPDRIGKPREKSEADKEADKKLLEEIENDPQNPKGMTHEEGGIYDPLQAQAEALPAGIRGADGFAPDSHVEPVSGEHSQPASKQAGETFSDDDDLGGGIVNPDDLTAD